jgi:hypothetical protein
MSTATTLLLLDRHAQRPPLKPARDRLVTVQLHFQGLEIQSAQYGQLPIFEVFAPSLSQEDQLSLWATKKAAGDTHALVALAYRYNEPGQIYAEIPGGDYTENLPGFRAIVLDRIHRGFYPLISLASEGQFFNPDRNTYGWQWGLDHMKQIIDSIRDLLDYCIPFGGFELLGPSLPQPKLQATPRPTHRGRPEGGNWTPDQLEAYYLQLRDVAGPNACLALELEQGYNKWRADGVACWSSPAGQAIDVFLQKFPQPIDQNWDGCQQLASRSLGPAARNIAPRNVGPWYQAQPTPRGPRMNVGFDFDLYDQLHYGKTPADIETDRRRLHSLGYPCVS